MRSKYTKDVLGPIVAVSTSLAQVLKRLELRLSGGSQSHVKRRILELGLPTDHFRGMGANRGAQHVGGTDKLHWREVLVYDRVNGRKENRARLRRALIESGVPYICRECKGEPLWRGKPLVIQIEHRDGDSLNNRRSNLEFLCPNCHSQTATFGSKNIGNAQVAQRQRQ